MGGSTKSRPSCLCSGQSAPTNNHYQCYVVTEKAWASLKFRSGAAIVMRRDRRATVFVKYSSLLLLIAIAAIAMLSRLGGGLSGS